MSSVSNRTHNVVCESYKDGVARVQQCSGRSKAGRLTIDQWALVCTGVGSSVQFWDPVMVCMVSLVPGKKLLAKIADIVYSQPSNFTLGAWKDGFVEILEG